LFYVDQAEWRVGRRNEHDQSGRRRIARLAARLWRRKRLRLRFNVPARMLQAGDRQALLPERVYVSAALLGHQAALL
jgi:hypothetical protein